MADLNQTLHNAAAKPSREAPLATIETRLRRRRFLRKGAVGVCAIALVGAISGGVALSIDDGPSIKTGLPPAAAEAYGVADPPISVELPDGWVESSIEPGLGWPNAVLLVGTALQPSGDAQNPCPGGLDYADDVFVTLRELNFSATEVAFPERPVDFALAPRTENSCFPGGDPPLGPWAVFGITFQDSGRTFEAIIGAGPQSSIVLRAEAYAALNSLIVTPFSDVPEPTVPTVPPSTVPTTADTEAITAAFLGWIDTRPIDASGVFIEDFASIRDAIIGAAEANGHPDDYTGRVEAITRIGENDADVIYSFIIDGQVVVGNLSGHAVKINGVWLVSRDTVCDALTYGPVLCPARE